jgi:hypothetical protein
MNSPLIIAAIFSAVIPQNAESGVRIGQSVVVDGPRVTPLAILEDSRCPANARCIWAGQVRIRVRIGSRKARVFKELTLGTPVPVADGALTLTQVSPFKITQQPLKSRDYRFGFRFEGGL